MHLLVLALFITYHSTIISAGNECNSPNRISCSNVLWARKCGQLEGCLKLWGSSKWIKHQNDASAECTYCVYIASQKSTTLATKALCSLRNISNIGDNVCEKVVSSMKTSSESQSRYSLCNSLTLCNTHVYYGTLGFGTPICNECKELVSDVRTLITKNATKDIIADRLKILICDKFPADLKNYCEVFLMTHVTTVIEMINEYINPEHICGLLGLCDVPYEVNVPLLKFLPPAVDDGSYSPEFSAPITHTKCPRSSNFNNEILSGSNVLNKDNDCGQCRAVFQYMKDNVLNPQILEKLKHTLERGICYNLPLVARFACITEINNHMEEVTEMIQKMNVDEICTLFQMCVAAEPRGGVALLSPGVPLPGVCELCEIVMNKLSNLVLDEKSEESIVAALGQVCDLIPQHYKEKCDSLVEQYGPKIVHAFIHGMGSKLICTAINLCPGYVFDMNNNNPEKAVDRVTASEQSYSWIRRPSAKDHAFWTSKKQHLKNSIENCGKPSCDVCESVLQTIKTVFKKPSARPQLVTKLKQLCSLFPAYKSICIDAIEDHFDEIAQMFDLVDVHDVCSAFGMCSNQPSNRVHVSAMARSPRTCRLCELVVKNLLRALWNETTEAAITNALSEVCYLVPMQYRASCDRFIKLYGSVILNVITDGTAPELICYTIGLCDTSSTDVAIINPSKQYDLSSRGGDDFKCHACHFIVLAAKKLLSDNETVEEIENRLKNLCAMLPTSVSDTCNMLVTSYLAIILQSLEADIDENYICQLVHLCPAVKGDINGEVCQHGPKLWCSSYSAAVVCNAVSYCGQSLWEKNRDSIFLAVCATNNLDTICQSMELAEKCGKSEKCLEYRIRRYMQSSLGQKNNSRGPVVESSVNCTICTKLIHTMRGQVKMIGYVISKTRICSMFLDKLDREQCALVVKNSQIQEQLVRNPDNDATVCKNLQLCTTEVDENREKESTSMNLACAEGPSFWCTSRRNAAACGATSTCESLNWFAKKTDDAQQSATLPDKDIFGINVCDWGSTYWCKSMETAKQCGLSAVQYCQKYVWRKSKGLGSDPCTWGPTYWCASEANARSCGPRLVDHCRRLRLFGAHATK